MKQKECMHGAVNKPVWRELTCAACTPFHLLANPVLLFNITLTDIIVAITNSAIFCINVALQA